MKKITQLDTIEYHTIKNNIQSQFKLDFLTNFILAMVTGFGAIFYKYLYALTNSMTYFIGWSFFWVLLLGLFIQVVLNLYNYNNSLKKLNIKFFGGNK